MSVAVLQATLVAAAALRPGCSSSAWRSRRVDHEPGKIAANLPDSLVASPVSGDCLRLAEKVRLGRNLCAFDG
jgi:hypothetical protein